RPRRGGCRGRPWASTARKRLGSARRCRSSRLARRADVLGVGRAGPIAIVARAVEPAPPPERPPPIPGAPGRTDRPRLTERQAWAVLTSVEGLGPVGFGALLRRFGSGQAILARARAGEGGG